MEREGLEIDELEIEEWRDYSLFKDTQAWNFL